MAAMGDPLAMNIQTDTHRNLAEALTPLSAVTVSEAQPSLEERQEHGPSWTLRIFLLLGLLAVDGAVLWRSDLPTLAALRNWGEGLLDPASQSVATDVPIAPTPVSDATTRIQPAPVAMPTAEITGSGYVLVQDYASVFAKYEGTITDLLVALGDPVTRGQPLAAVSDPGAQYALKSALIDQSLAQLRLETKRIEVDQSERDYDRLTSLLAKDAVSERVTQDAATALSLAKTALRQAEQDIHLANLKVEIAQEHVDELTIRAPVSGTITQLNARIGNSVLARVDTIRDTDYLMVITDTASMYLDAEVAETNVSRLRVGLTGEAVLDGFPDQPFEVRVVGISPVVSAERGTISLRLELDGPPDGIRPNMAARIRITLSDT
ncbi:efflux RND transporter periplasmic adaptor subunit [Phaeobacter sp. BS34]